MSTWILRTATLGALLCTVSSARADGLAARAIDVPESARTTLARAIDVDRAAHPELYAALRHVHGLQPEVYKQRRNPVPSVGPELRRLGAEALLPMLDALAFHAPAFDRVTTELERTVLVVGLLDAVGVLRDPRSGAVVRAVFEAMPPGARSGASAPDPRVIAAAAEALGKLCGEPELATLLGHAKASDPLQSASIRGLGECRTVESASRLASLLAAASESDARLLASALSIVGSRFAWQASGPAAAPQGLIVRGVAARALVAAFVRRPALRARAGAALQAVAHPDTVALLDEARGGADADTAVAIDRLLRDLARSATR